MFKLYVSGIETVLYSFAGGADGAGPNGPIVFDPSGNYYGTTIGGGGSSRGVVFKIDSSGKETVLHTFTGGSDGDSPAAGLIRDEGGALYGTTYDGGGSTGCFGQRGCGTVFKVDPNGDETVLYRFDGGTDGLNPYDTLVMNKSGNLFGTALFGGGCPETNLGCGVVFKLTP